MVLLSEELLGVTLDGYTTLTFLLTGIKVVGETERCLTLLFGHSLKLGHLTIRDSTLLEDEVTAGSTLTSINVSTDNNGEVLFSTHGYNRLLDVIKKKSQKCEMKVEGRS